MAGCSFFWYSGCRIPRCFSFRGAYNPSFLDVSWIPYTHINHAKCRNCTRNCMKYCSPRRWFYDCLRATLRLSSRSTHVYIEAWFIKKYTILHIQHAFLYPFLHDLGRGIQSCFAVSCCRMAGNNFDAGVAFFFHEFSDSGFLNFQAFKAIVKFSTTSCIMADGFSSKSLPNASCARHSAYLEAYLECDLSFWQGCSFLGLCCCCLPLSSCFIMDIGCFGCLRRCHEFLLYEKEVSSSIFVRVTIVDWFSFFFRCSFFHINVFGLFNFNDHFFVLHVFVEIRQVC